MKSNHDQPDVLTCEAFHNIYYRNAGRTWQNTYWLGVPVQKYPADLWIYQELLLELKPDWIIETGTCHGGSALFLASICDLIQHGRVLTIDIVKPIKAPKHCRITYFEGSSVDPYMIQKMKARIRSKEKVLVILDSDHSQQHVAKELEVYSPLVTPGSYLIVEDTNINGHPVLPEFGPGPMEAVREFLKSHQEFVVDSEREKFYITANPGGYLKKISIG